jgi:hypothetical protein
MSNLLDELGLDPNDFNWEDLALCAGLPTEMFYDLYESDVETAKAIDEGCLRCPVFQECFMKGADGEYGVWGGVYWNGAGRPDKNKNAHKTEETWDEIYRRAKGG